MQPAPYVMQLIVFKQDPWASLNSLGDKCLHSRLYGKKEKLSLEQWVDCKDIQKSLLRHEARDGSLRAQHSNGRPRQPAFVYFPTLPPSTNGTAIKASAAQPWQQPATPAPPLRVQLFRFGCLRYLPGVAGLVIAAYLWEGLIRFSMHWHQVLLDTP